MDSETTNTAPLSGALESPAEQTWEGWVASQEPGGPAAPHQPLQAEPAAPVPYDRYQEALQAHRDLETRYAPLQGWAPALQQLAELGITPEQFTAQLQARSGAAAPPPPTSEEQFTAWLAEHQLDPATCSPAEKLSLQSTWRHEQLLAQFEQKAQAAEQRAFQIQWQADLQSLSTHYPEFANPVLRDALLNTYEGRFGVQPDAQQLDLLAQELRGAIQTLTQAQVIRYAQHKGQDAAVPLVAGGHAPAPVQAVDFHQLNPTQQQDFLESHFAAASRDA